MEEVYHIPALLPECLDALDIRPGGTYVDVTYGGGGHSRAIMERLSAEEGGHLYSFDQDRDAIERAASDPRFTLILSNFRYIVNFLRYYDVEGVDGVLADLGVSFHHFDDAERGFSFRAAEAPLDMRMNRAGGRTAAMLLNTLDAEALGSMFRLYGEFAKAGRLADAIVKAREGGRKFERVADFLEVCAPFIDPRKEKKAMAQLFQALRIEVNDEMGALREMLQGALKVLRPGGRLAVITYHSLEDRLVKNFFKTGNFEGRVEKDFFGRVEAPLKPLGSKPIVPGDDEIERNPRSRSAKLRVAVKL